MKTILIADDHDLVREAIASFLQSDDRYEVLQCDDVASALRHLDAERAGPDIILLDFKMQGMKGLAGLSQVMAKAPGIPVAIISGEATHAVAEQALDAGAAGFIPKTMGLRAMLNAIDLMLAGEQFAPVRWMREEQERGANASGDLGLTPREAETLRCLLDGKSNKEIARDLDVQEVTVKLHLKSLYQKLGAKNRTHAVLLAMEKGLGD